MILARTYKCPFDGATFTKIPDLVKYVERHYKNDIPKKYDGDVERYLYDYRNTPGTCQICNAPTTWSDKNKRYNILCEPLSWKRLFSDPFHVVKTFVKNRGNSCHEVMRKAFINNAQKKWGTSNLMAIPGYQEDKLLKNRSIARIVSFKGKEFTVIGSYEERFLNVCRQLPISANEIDAPGPEIRWVKDGMDKLHITDFFLSKYQCVVSIKDGGSNKNTHPSMIGRREADAHKFKAILDKTNYNAIELNGLEEIDNFPEIFKQLQKSKDRFIIYPEYYKDYIKK